MPYPNEHSCRLRNPGDFQPDSFRRTSREHEGKRYDCIVGRLKGQDTMAEQAYRYPKTSWDADEARKHCQAHDGSFEAASESEDGAMVRRGHCVHVANYVMNTPWAILPSTLAMIMDLLRFYAAGNRFNAEEVRERIGAASRPSSRITGAVAVLPLVGVIAHRMDLMTETSGGTSVEGFTRGFRQALADPQVGAIVIDVDSPGGAVDGIDELSAEIYRARGQKPITAVANSLAASAAYWIATAADELVVTPSGEVGSIGVIAAHEDLSAAAEMKGVKVTLISAGKYKAEGNPFEALGDEGRGAIQERVDEYYEMFVRAVARNRGVGVAEVREGYGEGRVVGAKRAQALGMVDRVATLDETIERMMSRKRERERAAAEIDDGRRRLRAAAR